MNSEESEEEEEQPIIATTTNEQVVAQRPQSPSMSTTTTTIAGAEGEIFNDGEENRPSSTTLQQQQQQQQTESGHQSQEENEEKNEEEETKFVEWDPTGRFGRTTQLFGRGTYKNVYKAFDEEEGMDVAWNQVKVSGLPPEEKQRLMHEVELLKKLNHKNILKFYHSWNVMEKGEMSVNFITEACEGTLNKYAARFKSNLDMRAVKSWCRQILRGLEYLHCHDPPIVHRDLKCDNIFVNGNAGEIKIGDLGLAAMLNHQRTHSVIGTPEFMAPELYEEDYDERVDIYSFGMCLIELITFKCPYSECKNPAQIYKRVSQGILPEALEDVKEKGEAIYNFVLKCIAPKEERWTATELLADPFLEKKLSRPRNLPRAVVEEEPEAPRPNVSEHEEEDQEFETSSNNVESSSLANAPPNVGAVQTGGETAGTPVSDVKTKALHSIKEVSMPATPGGRFYRVVSNTESASELPVGHFEQRERGASLNIRVRGLMMDNNTLRLRLRITDQSSGQTRTVEFPFSKENDSAQNVAKEMVDELQLSEADVETIEREINKEVKFLSEEGKTSLESTEQHSSGDSFEEMRAMNGLNNDGASSDQLSNTVAFSTKLLRRVDSARSVDSQDHHQQSAGGSPEEERGQRSPQKSPIVLSSEVRQSLDYPNRAPSPSIVVGRSKTFEGGSEGMQQLGLDVKSLSLSMDERVERSHSSGSALAPQQHFQVRDLSPTYKQNGSTGGGGDSSASASNMSSPLTSPPAGAINNSNYPEQIPADALANGGFVSLPPKHPQLQSGQQPLLQQSHEASAPSRSETPALSALDGADEEGDIHYDDEMELQILEELDKMQQQEEAEMRHRHATERQKKVRAFHKRRLERSVSRLALGSSHQSDGNLVAASQPPPQQQQQQQQQNMQQQQQQQQSQMTQTQVASSALYQQMTQTQVASSALYQQQQQPIFQPVPLQQQQQQTAGGMPPLAPSQSFDATQPLINGHLQSAATTSIGSDLGTSSIGTMSRDSSKASMSSDIREEDVGKVILSGEQMKEAKEKKKKAALDKMNALTGSCLTGLDVVKGSQKSSQVALKDSESTKVPTSESGGE